MSERKLKEDNFRLVLELQELKSTICYALDAFFSDETKYGESYATIDLVEKMQRACHYVPEERRMMTGDIRNAIA